jgi:hypothetical protein
MPRVALPDSVQLCKIFGCLYTPYIQDRRSITRFIIDQPRTSQLQLRCQRRLLHATHLSRSCWVSSDTGHHRLEASLRSARIQCLPEVGPARLLVAMLGDLGISTLRSIKTMTQFSSLLSIKPAMLPTTMLGDYSTSVSSTPSCFPRRTDLLGNPLLITSLLDLLFLFFGSSYWPSCPPRCSDTTP